MNINSSGFRPDEGEAVHTLFGATCIHVYFVEYKLNYSIHVFNARWLIVPVSWTGWKKLLRPCWITFRTISAELRQIIKAG